MKIKPKKKHRREHIIEARIRREGKVQRLARLWGLDREWLLTWGKRRLADRTPCSCPACQHHDDEPPYRERKLLDHERDDAEDGLEETGDGATC